MLSIVRALINSAYCRIVDIAEQRGHAAF